MKTFIEYFIQRKGYSQNPLLDAKEFIKQAEVWGIRIDLTTLESLERQKLLYPMLRYVPKELKSQSVVFRKNGIEYMKRKGSMLGIDEEYVRENEERFLSSLGTETEWMKSYKEGRLYEPEEKGYERWKTFEKKGKVLKISYYSSFQLFMLDEIIERLERKILTVLDKIHIPKRRWIEEVIATDKSFLKKKSERFSYFLKFLLLSQSAFLPYATSGGGTITITGDTKQWRNLKTSYQYQAVLAFVKIEREEIMYWYKLLVEKAEDKLGGIRANNSDWLQLWKEIAWKKKNILKGSIKAGVDCLQWALMVKAIVEFANKIEIPDIDEISNVGFADILKINLKQWTGNWNSRHIRNMRNIDLSIKQYNELESINSRLQKNENKNENKERIQNDFNVFHQLGFSINWEEKIINFDQEKSIVRNYYHDRQRRVYYLSNTFGLGYQSRVILFVEGPTEEIVIPEIMKWYYSPPYNIGIDIISMNGVDNWFGGNEFNLKEQHDLKPIKKLVSNFNSLLTYNINKWQTIPFILADNEGNLKALLDNGLELKIQGESAKLKNNPKIVYIWGDSNKNLPFKGASFELANFSNGEILEVLKKYVNDETGKNVEYSEETIQELRDTGKAFNLIDRKDKPAFAHDLFNNLRNDIESGKIKGNVFERPIFKMLDIVIQHAVLNHQPNDRITETTNKQILKKLISGEEITNNE